MPAAEEALPPVNEKVRARGFPTSFSPDVSREDKEELHLFFISGGGFLLWEVSNRQESKEKNRRHRSCTVSPAPAVLPPCQDPVGPTDVRHHGLCLSERCRLFKTRAIRLSPRHGTVSVLLRSLQPGLTSACPRFSLTACAERSQIPGSATGHWPWLLLDLQPPWPFDLELSCTGVT